MKNKLETGGYYETSLSLEPPLVHPTYVCFYCRIFYRMYHQPVRFRSVFFVRAAARGHAGSHPPDTDGGDHPHAHRLQLHDLLCNTDGWGENLRGLINYPDSLPSYEDAVVMMEDVAAVYAGDWVTLILCSDGTLWGVGSGLFGLLPERAASQDAYDPLFLMSDVVMAAVSSESACALRSDGTVWSWGGSEGFQPEQILKGIVKIAAYSSGHYALDIDGTLYVLGSLLPLEVDRNECWLTPQPILEGVTDMASTGRRLLVQKGDSSLWRMGWWEGYQYQPLEKWMDNVVYFTADLAVTGDHTLWYLASDTPSMIMNNVACAVNGEQGILALDWDGGLWLHPQEGDGSADAVHLCDDIWVPESWYSQQQSRNTD